MLKRQRAASPLPSSPSLPQGTFPEDVIDIRELKRRRVAPPSLNGQTRGWHNPPNHDLMEEEYDEERELEEEEESDRNSEAKIAQAAMTTKYAAVNSVLKEMHILQKHRQMFSSSFQPEPETSPRGYHDHAKTRTVYYHEREPATESESARVYEHYEGTNRSLASAFLSRRIHNSNHP